ncbi:bifunctional homocysteine S-methyltransferase/methylenetetrahydrofolate reductase [Carboxydochorda subterranea]|uniref:Bifunctional homocysteine S-methyltransferase/methylenetetrahydrofolate reductase n=1 Tax=Carboxydichorda subterranea TaxID=3109565 RepID=A0ABZ1BX02_9FIRM|nr:bifunctional homocysteine S-methyltransferase/methylenetetrahydrofolate reductase [Limnochorda sp. L945t]WRP17056.1 bifunctional homocysteine S-methyltransferase/methylenetetrahydrofolate reductase [Limnochorda sp. L945t]
MSFEQALASGRILLADGAMGTLLYARGAPLEGSFDALNLTNPDLVRGVHLDYILAGAELVTTNTFGANRVRLAAHGLEDQVRAINLAGVKIARAARETAGVPVLIAGDVGPTGRPLAPIGALSEQAALDAFREQVDALLAGGVDLFIIETMSDPRELVLAVRAAREASKLPVIAEMSFSSEGRTLLGASPKEAADALAELASELRPEVIGVNCGSGPAPVLDAVRALREAGGPFQRFSAMPNAGLPTVVGGRFVYVAIPEYFGEFARRFAGEPGMQVIGGCCGTTPDHIRAMRQALDALGHTLPPDWAQALQGMQGTPRVERQRALEAGGAGSRMVVVSPPGAPYEGRPVPAGREPAGVAGREEGAERGGSGLALALGRRFVISVELDPPRGPVVQKLLGGARSIRDSGADAVNVGDSPMAQVRMSSLAAAHLIQAETGIETILHFTTRDRNLMGIQADLLGAHAMGIRNILALTGDPPGLGNYAHASAVYDIDSIGLVRVLAQLNQGVDVAGRSIGQATQFLIGVALSPAARDLDTEIERFRKKVEAAAHFAMTQPLFELDPLLRVLDRLGGAPIPLLLGVLPLRSYQHAEYLHHEVPGISIPERIRRALEKARDAAEQVGMEVALQVAVEASPYVAGVYVVPSFGRYEQACELVRAIRQHVKKPAAGEASGG